MQRLEQASILLVDNDVESLFTVASLLIKLKHRVVTARNLHVASVLAANEVLDLVITSSRLRTVSGIEFAEALKRTPGREGMPVMFLCNRQIPGVILRRHDFGDAYHLQTPVNACVLGELIRKSLGLSSPINIRVNSEEAINEPHVSFVKNPFPKVGVPIPFGNAAFSLGSTVSQ